jgi:hypothetical protein
MSPIDSNPPGAAVVRSPDEGGRPSPNPGRESDAPPRGQPGAEGDVQPGLPSRPGERGPDVISGGRDPILGTGEDIAG